MQKTSSWADEADNDVSISDFPAPPPPPVSNAWKINDAKPKATGVVFEDFEGPVDSKSSGNRGGSDSRDFRGGSYDRDRGDGRGGYGDRGYGDDRGYGHDRGGPRGDRDRNFRDGGRGNDDSGRLIHADEAVDRGGPGRRGGYGGREGYEDRGGYDGGRGGYGDRRGGDRGGYGPRGGGGEQGGWGGGDRGGFGGRDRGGRYGDDEPGWRQNDYGGRGGPREDRGDRRGDRFQWEAPTEEVLARIPEAGPWTAFVTVHPSVAKEVEEGELRDYFHDGEKIKVEKVRIVLHRDTGNVKMAFVDFDDAASLRNALYLQEPFRDRPLKVDIAEPKKNDRPDRPERPRAGFQGGARREPPGLKATAYDVDTEEPDWMARRVHEKLDLDAAAAAGPAPGEAAQGGGAREGGERVVARAGGEGRANPFGNAKPRDESEYERKLEAQRKARAEEQRRAAEEKRRREADAGREKEGGAGRPKDAGRAGDGAGDWRNDAKPLDPRPPRKPDSARPISGKPDAARGPPRQGGKEGSKRWEGKGGDSGDGKRPNEWGTAAADKKADAAPAVSSKKVDAVAADKKKAEPRKEQQPQTAAAADKKQPANMFDLLGEDDS